MFASTKQVSAFELKCVWFLIRVGVNIDISWFILDRRMKLSLIDCPHGYTSRVMESKEYEIPSQAKLFPAQVLPLIRLMLQAKVIIKQVTEPVVMNITMNECKCLIIICILYRALFQKLCNY